MTRFGILTTAVACLIGVLCSEASLASTVTFGTGVNQFTLDFVTIGNPGNAADTTGMPNPVGSVPYAFSMGQYEVSRDMIAKANNISPLGITLADMGSFGGNLVNRPATGISWNEAARFVNWLNINQGFQPAYKFAIQPGDGGYNANANLALWISGDPGFNAANPFRNSLAHYFLPNVNEWYKAAYYNPVSGNYFDYPTGSNSAPTPVASGTTAGTAVYNGQIGPADISVAGGPSPYGTIGQGGNASEWEETEFDLVNNSVSASRGLRGGKWNSISSNLSVSDRTSSSPTSEFADIGFRVASVVVPEPSSLTLAAFGLGGSMVVWWRRRGRVMMRGRR